MSNTNPTNDVEQKYGSQPQGLRYQFSDFVLCTKQNILMRGEEMVQLNAKAMQCLTLLVTNPNKVVFREAFFDQVWSDCFVGDGVLSVNISCLRKLLGKDAIKTYSGKGYTFKKRVEVIDDNKPWVNRTEARSEVQVTTVSLVDRLRAIVIPCYSKFAH